jgi:hypothetical protein
VNEYNWKLQLNKIEDGEKWIDCFEKILEISNKYEELKIFRNIHKFMEKHFK